MRLVNLRANEVVIRNTKYGEKILITASGDLKSDIKIWRPTTDPIAQMISPNAWFQACVDSTGKYSPVASSTDPGVLPTQDPAPYVPESSYSPLANMPKPEVLETKPATPAVHPHIQKLAEVMSQCVSAIRAEIPGLDSESEQKYATSLFIAVQKDFY